MPLAHQLRDLVGVEIMTQTQDAAGFPVETWAPVGNFWAKKLYKSGGTRETQEEDTSFDRVEWIFRNEIELTPRHRVLYRNEYYEVKAADLLIDRSGFKVITERRGAEWQ